MSPDPADGATPDPADGPAPDPADGPAPEPGDGPAPGRGDRLRLALMADLGAIMALEPRLFGAQAWSRATYETELSMPGRQYVVAEHDGAVVGYAGIDLSPEATIMTVGVDPAFRRRGLASAMVRHLVQAARQRGCREVHLEVRADDAGAQRLYAGLGFEPIGRRPRYYGSIDAVTMRLRLNRVGPVGW